MSILVGGCRKHGAGCRCTPGVVTQNLELFAECVGDGHEGERLGLVCCDQGHEFTMETGDVLELELHTEDRFPNDQRGHVWSEGPMCRDCCMNHGKNRRNHE